MDWDKDQIRQAIDSTDEVITKWESICNMEKDVGCIPDKCSWCLNHECYQDEPDFERTLCPCKKILGLSCSAIGFDHWRNLTQEAQAHTFRSCLVANSFLKKVYEVKRELLKYYQEA